MPQELSNNQFGETSMLKGSSLEQAMQIADRELPAEHTQQQVLAEPTVETPAEQVQQPQEAPDAQPQSQEPSQGNVLELAEDALVRVKIDGEIQEVPYKDFKDSLQREAAWHKRQQQFAQSRTQFEQYYAQQLAELESAARAVKMYEQQVQSQAQPKQAPQAQPVAQPSVDEIATLSEVRQEAERVGQTIEQKLAARDQLFAQQLQNAAQRLQAEMVQKQEGMRFTKGLQEVLSAKEFKGLEVIPNLEQNLRYEVWNTKPQTIEEAIDAANAIAKVWSQKLKTIHVAEQQQADAKKAKAKLEPSDGSPAAPKNAAKVKAIGRDGKLDFNVLRQQAMALLD